MKPKINPLVHGGKTRDGLRKVARPFEPELPLFVTIRASRAKGAWSFLHPRNRGRVYWIVLDTAARYSILLHDWENVGNHLHFLLQASSRRQMQCFLRVMPQRIVFAVTGASRNRRVGRFWDGVAHSRVVRWGEEFEIVMEYLWKNRLEALGIDKVEIEKIRRNARKFRLHRFTPRNYMPGSGNPRPSPRPTPRLRRDSRKQAQKS